MNDRRLVWDSDSGSQRKRSAKGPRQKSVPRGDGIVRIRREIGGRRGKAVTTILGLPLVRADLDALASELKKRCGVGGAAKDGVIELQGDQRDTVETELRARGYEVKRAGG